MSPVVQYSVNDTSEDPLCSRRWVWLAELLVPWLLSIAGQRFGFHVSTCDELISATSAAHSDWRQCLLRTEAFE